MDINAIIQVISTVGFPIAVAVYLLFANEKMRQTVEDNSKVIAELKTIMTLYVKELREGGKNDG